MAIDTPTSTPTENTPPRLLLVSVPRTASNLFLKIIDIHHQPNVLTSEKGGYFFYNGFMTATRDGHLNKPLDQWTDAETNEARDAFQKCLDNLEEYSAQAQRDNKIMFAKEHAFWFVNPTAMYSQPEDSSSAKTNALETCRLCLPESYGSKQTFSANNQTVLPDEYLRTWRLAFLIRHPALAWP